jgi:MYXO-CTERM domain-containing protein
MFSAPVMFSMPNGDLPAFNDSTTTSLLGEERLFEIALKRWNDPTFAAALQGSNRGRDALFSGVETVPKASSIKLQSALFPSAGYGVLRAGDDKLRTYLALDFGPHGGGHGHYDKLGFVYYARQSVLAIDPGTQPYAAPTHATWDKMTIAHNTVVVDEKTQAEATGNLHQFLATPVVSVVSADAGKAYTTAKLLRTMLSTPEYVVDRFHTSSTDTADHKFDYILHAPGKSTSALPLTAYSSFPQSDGYQHLTSSQSAQSDSSWSAQFQQATAGGNVGSAWASATGISASLTYSTDQASSGSWSAKASYDFSKAQGSALYTFATPSVPQEIPSELRFRLFGDKSGNKLTVRFNDASDERFVFAIGPIDWNGWKDISAKSPEAWSHFLGNNDGIIDLPVKSTTVQIDSVANGTLASQLYIDDINLHFPKAGDYLLQDFELIAANLNFVMDGAAGTRVVLGKGLGPDLTVPVPFAMARRSGKDAIFQSLLEPYGDAPKVKTFAPLPTQAPEAIAVSVKSDSYSDSVFALTDPATADTHTFGESSCDGALCFIRRDAKATLIRFAGAKLTKLTDSKIDLLISKAALDSISADYLSDSTVLALQVGSSISSELRILGPQIKQVTVNGVDTSFEHDGDYVVIDFVPVADAGSDASSDGAAAGDAQADVQGDSQNEASSVSSEGTSSDSSGCGCSLPKDATTGWWWGVAAAGIIGARVRRKKIS